MSSARDVDGTGGLGVALKAVGGGSEAIGARLGAVGVAKLSSLHKTQERALGRVFQLWKLYPTCCRSSVCRETF